MPGVFVTGTDTEIGKTQVACALLHALNKHHIKTAGMKPVASGAEWVNGQFRNEDALRLIHASSVKLPYEQVNPYVFKTAASPHISSGLEHQDIELNTIKECFNQVEQQSEFVVVEGVGGWLAPLNENQTVADMAEVLQLPVVLVVGMRLGCLNHALLTAQHIQNSHLKLTGWIANCVDNNFSYLEENIDALSKRIDAPLLARLDFDKEKFCSEYEKSISSLVDS
ncbi:MAG: dethiobiotin synthase [Gammaproteobacteria bacterium]